MGAVRAAQMEEIDHENKQVSNFLVSDVTIFPPYLPMLLFFPPIFCAKASPSTCQSKRTSMWLRGVDGPPIVQQIQIGNR